MTSNDLENVTQFILPRRVLVETIAALRKWGDAENEARVVWAGRFETVDRFRFTEAIVPRQSNTLIETLVDQTEMTRLNEYAWSKRVTLAAQVHTHPGEAFHSRTDDREPIVTEEGALSIVIPDFAEGKARHPDAWKAYRLQRGHWRAVRLDGLVVEVEG